MSIDHDEDPRYTQQYAPGIQFTIAYLQREVASLQRELVRRAPQPGRKASVRYLKLRAEVARLQSLRDRLSKIEENL